SDDFLHARHLAQSALLHLTLIAGYTDRGPRRARHGVWAIAHQLNLLTDGAHLFFRGMRLHDDQHESPIQNPRVYRAAAPRANAGSAFHCRSDTLRNHPTSEAFRVATTSPVHALATIGQEAAKPGSIIVGVFPCRDPSRRLGRRKKDHHLLDDYQLLVAH